MAVLTDKGREAKRKYKRQWDKEHSESNKIYRINYWNKIGEQMAAEQKIKINEKMKEV